jgi:hypothetical protein
LTIHRIADIKENLHLTLNRAGTLRIDVSGATSVDFTFLQLLCSGHRTAVAMDKKLEWIGPVSRVFLKAVEAGGFSRHIGCAFGLRGDCLWTQLSGDSIAKKGGKLSEFF